MGERPWPAWQYGMVSPRHPPPPDQTFDMWLLNMHDVFMTANLLRECTDREPIVSSDPEGFTVSRRGRLERCFLRDLAVLLETWRTWPENYERLRSHAPREYDEVVYTIDDGIGRGLDRHVIAVRDYMSHRDRRIYWDEGRIAVAKPGVFEWSRRLERAFGRFFLSAMRAMRSDSASD